jgi:hypothetical protein
MNQDNARDPIAERINRNRERKSADNDAAAGERQLAQDFAAVARQNGPGEVTNIETALAARTEDINVGLDAGAPRFEYDANRHLLSAGSYALQLHLTHGFNPHRFDMTVGLPPDAAQMFAEIPEVESSTWTFFAHTDENGFFWEDTDGHRWQNKEIVNAGLEALANLLDN